MNAPCSTVPPSCPLGQEGVAQHVFGQVIASGQRVGMAPAHARDTRVCMVSQDRLSRLAFRLAAFHPAAQSRSHGGCRSLRLA